ELVWPMPGDAANDVVRRRRRARAASLRAGEDRRGRAPGPRAAVSGGGVPDVHGAIRGRRCTAEEIDRGGDDATGVYPMAWAGYVNRVMLLRLIRLCWRRLLFREVI